MTKRLEWGKVAGQITWEGILIIWVRNDDGLNASSNDGDGEMWKVGRINRTRWLIGRGESKVSGFNGWKERYAISWDEQHRRKSIIEWKTGSIFKYWCLPPNQNLQARVTGDSEAQPGLRDTGEDPNMGLRTRGPGSLRLRKHGQRRRRKAKENMSWKSTEKEVSDT